MSEQASRPVVIFVLGGPGSGKGTQCQIIPKKYPYANFVHLSTGSLLRQASQTKSAENKEIQRLMKEGKMVTSRPLVQLIKNTINKMGCNNKYILDGFPRNKQNAQVWKQVIGDQFDVRFLLYFECPQKQLRNRLLDRAKTSGRADDNPQTIEKRLKTFVEETKPILSMFKKVGGTLININGAQKKEQVQRDVTIMLKQQRLI